MKHSLWMTVLAVLVYSTCAYAQEPQAGTPGPRRQPRPGPQPEMELRMRNHALDLERKQMEIEFERQMRGLKLKERRLAVERAERAPACRKCARQGTCKKLPFLLVCAVVHVLLSIWGFQDIRQRGKVSGIWIVITLLAGFFGAVVYAIVRLGDARKTE